MKKKVNNYSIYICEVRKFENTDVFQTDIKQVFDCIRYAENPEKTDGGRLVSSYECLPETAAVEFAAGKYIYKATT